MTEPCFCGLIDCKSCHPEYDGVELITHKMSISITSSYDGVDFAEESIRSLLKEISKENNITWHEV